MHICTKLGDGDGESIEGKQIEEVNEFTYLKSPESKGLVKKYRGGGGVGPEQRGGASSGFESLVKDGSCNFYLPVGGGSSCFYYWN